MVIGVSFGAEAACASDLDEAAVRDKEAGIAGNELRIGPWHDVVIRPWKMTCLPRCPRAAATERLPRETTLSERGMETSGGVHADMDADVDGTWVVGGDRFKHQAVK